MEVGSLNEDTQNEEVQNEDALRQAVTLEEPLGPPETEPLVSNEKVFLDLYDKTNGFHVDARVERPYYVIGRKGAGKTAFLVGTALADKTDVARIKSEDVYTRINNLVISYSKEHGVPVADELAYVWEVVFFHAAMLAIVRSKRTYTPVAARTALWDYLSAFGNPDEIRDDDLFAKVISLISRALEAPSDGAFRSNCWSIGSGGNQFEDAVVRTREILAGSGSKSIYVVVDNMEDLHQRLGEFALVIRALFRLVGRGKASDEKPFPFRLRFAFPAELLDDLTALAPNAGKDFRNRLVIRWTAAELMALAGNRLRLFLNLYFPDAVSKLGLPKRHDPKDIEAARLTLRALLPAKMENGFGGVEKGEAYLMRHTQLLPRHMVVMLNQVISKAVLDIDPDEVPQVTPEQLVSGIFEAERGVLDEVFSAYSSTHPGIKENLRVLKNRIKIVEKTGDLHSIYHKTGVHKRGGREFADFLQAGFHIGVFGVMTGESQRYTEGAFSYTSAQEITPVEDTDQICVHPLFIQHLFDRHVIDRMAGEGRKAIYPYGSDPSHLRVQA